MFNKDTNLIFEAYQTTLNEGKMKDIATAIEAGDDVDEIINDLNLDDTETIRAYITKQRDDFYEKGERADQIDAEDMEHEDMESCEEDDDEEDEEAVHEKLAGAIGGGIVGGLAAGPVGALLGAGAGDQLTDDEEDKTGDMSDKDLLNKVKKMGTAGDCLIKAAEERLKDGMSLTAHERDALARDAYGDAEKEIAKESVSYTTKYIL